MRSLHILCITPLYVNMYVCSCILSSTSLLGSVVGYYEDFQFRRTCSINCGASCDTYLTVFVMLVCRDHCSPFLRCPHFYQCLLGGTVGCHCDCIRSCYSCVIVAELQAETEGYARPYGWHRNECFNMQLTSAGSPFLFQSLDKGAPPTPPLPLLVPPKALTPSSSNQIPATVQWRVAIHDNAIAACLSGCT